MGTGTNVQKRLVALHHLDAPWKPAEVEQREGRILRQGNDNEEVAIYRYVTEGSFDAYMWQALETKARFISQVMTGDNAARRAEDIGGQELSYAEVKAIASGNPAVLTLAEADAELQRLAILKKNHADEQYLARRSLPRAARDHRPADQTPGRSLGRPGDRSPPMTAIRSPSAAGPAAATTHWPPSATASTPCRRKSAKPNASPSAGIAAWPSAWCCTPAVPPRCSWKEPPPATACFPATIAARGPCSTPSTGWPTATAANATPRRQDLAIAEGQLRDHEARLGRPFAHDAYLAELTDLRDQLKAGLSQATPEPGTPPVAELAERIKSLKAAHTIDAAPERTAPRRIAAEEPVTARIRRRPEAAPAIEPPAEPAASPAAMPTGRSRHPGPPRRADAAADPSSSRKPHPSSLPTGSTSPVAGGRMTASSACFSGRWQLAAVHPCPRRLKVIIIVHAQAMAWRTRDRPRKTRQVRLF